MRTMKRKGEKGGGAGLTDVVDAVFRRHVLHDAREDVDALVFVEERAVQVGVESYEDARVEVPGEKVPARVVEKRFCETLEADALAHVAQLIGL